MVVNNWYIIMVGIARESEGVGEGGGEGGRGRGEKGRRGRVEGIGNLVVVPFLRLCHYKLIHAMIGFQLNCLHQYCVSSLVGRICFSIPKI